jgi:hypothetical protein
MLAPKYPEWAVKIRKAKNADIDRIVEAVEAHDMLMGGGETEFVVSHKDERRIDLSEMQELVDTLAAKRLVATFQPCDCADCRADYEARMRANHFCF